MNKNLMIATLVMCIAQTSFGLSREGTGAHAITAKNAAESALAKSQARDAVLNEKEIKDIVDTNSAKGIDAVRTALRSKYENSEAIGEVSKSLGVNKIDLLQVLARAPEVAQDVNVALGTLKKATATEIERKAASNLVRFINIAARAKSESAIDLQGFRKFGEISTDSASYGPKAVDVVDYYLGLVEGGMSTGQALEKAAIDKLGLVKGSKELEEFKKEMPNCEA
jgi:hypothetical protein